MVYFVPITTWCWHIHTYHPDFSRCQITRCFLCDARKFFEEAVFTKHFMPSGFKDDLSTGLQILLESFKVSFRDFIASPFWDSKNPSRTIEPIEWHLVECFSVIQKMIHGIQM